MNEKPLGAIFEGDGKPYLMVCRGLDPQVILDDYNNDLSKRWTVWTEGQVLMARRRPTDGYTFPERRRKYRRDPSCTEKLQKNKKEPIIDIYSWQRRYWYRRYRQRAKWLLRWRPSWWKELVWEHKRLVEAN